MGRRATVLVVEDEDDVRDVAIGYVEALGYAVLAALKEILPNLAIMEIIGATAHLRFRYRLVGTAIVNVYGINPTGRFIDEITAGAYRDFLLGLLGEVATAGRALYAASAFQLAKT